MSLQLMFVGDRICYLFCWGAGLAQFDIVFHYMLGDRDKGFFLLASVSRPALSPIQALIQWVPG
jgi:hypothetical protein